MFSTLQAEEIIGTDVSFLNISSSFNNCDIIIPTWVHAKAGSRTGVVVPLEVLIPLLLALAVTRNSFVLISTNLRMYVDLQINGF